MVPDGIADTLWPVVREKCDELGIRFDDWQDGLGRLIFARRADGVYAHSVGGVVISIPRQVGKTFLVGSVAFALCLLEPGLTVIWTAHQLRTAEETFGSMQAMAKRKKIAPHVSNIYLGSGEQEVRFRNGSRILFGARERGFGLGFANVGMLVLDEAQRVTERTMDDMVPTMNRAKNPLLIMTGTPPRPSDAGETFSGKRRDALSGEDRDTVYVEFSADADADEFDRDQWAKANPSYPVHTTATAMLRMKKNLKGEGSFRREALGVWDGDTSKATIKARQWDSLAIPPELAPREGAVAYAVKFSTDGQRVGCGAARLPDDGPAHVEALGVSPMSAGTADLVTWLAERWRKGQIVIDGKAGAGDLFNKLVAAGVPKRRIHIVTTDEAITAHAGFLRAVQERSLTHRAQPGLDAAVRVAGKRKIGTAGGWGWQAVTPDGDVTPLETVTLALHAVTTGRRRTSDGRSSGNRTSGNRVGVVL